MDGNFDGLWADLGNDRDSALSSGIGVRIGAILAANFEINDIDGAAVIVRSGQMGEERRVSKGDFQRLFAFWSAYNRGTIGRAELGKRSQNTTYILSILHWREETQNSMAPAAPTSPAITPPQPAPIPATGLAGHDEYGKRVLRAATNHAALYGPTVEINYGAGQPARIDATVGDIAVEIKYRIETGSRRGSRPDLPSQSEEAAGAPAGPHGEPKRDR